MSKEDDYVEMEGEVVEIIRNAVYKVKLPNGHIIDAYVGGKLERRLGKKKIVVCDKVIVAISTYDLNRGRITNLVKRVNPAISNS